MRGKKDFFKLAREDDPARWESARGLVPNPIWTKSAPPSETRWSVIIFRSRS